MNYEIVVGVVTAVFFATAAAGVYSGHRYGNRVDYKNITGLDPPPSMSHRDVVRFCAEYRKFRGDPIDVYDDFDMPTF